jgi:predicted RecA/RadA family phage recombinase
MKNYVQEGKSLPVTAPAAVASGQYVTVGSIRGVAAYDAPQGEPVEVVTEGVFTLPKATADNVAAGDLLYWDAAAGKATKTAGTGSKPLVGVAVKAAGNGVATVDVKLGVHGLTGPA